jgi:hypothetical protein
MDGRIDDVAIWEIALAPFEAAYLYNGGDGRPVIETQSTSGTLFVVR